ncbi:SGE1 [Sanghuangporus weigelae]
MSSSHAGNTSPSQAQPAPTSTSVNSGGSTTTVGATNWTEPPWCGWIETTGDALIILEAARRGLIPRVTRRLVDAERKMITSGSVFVFDEDESGIKRWTDGFFWSPSRILGNFLLYRETDKRGAGHRGRSDRDANEGSSGSLLVSEHGQYSDSKDHQSLSRPKGESSGLGLDKHRERTLVGSLTNSYKFKPDGMMKKTFSLTIGGVSQHLISYYKIEDVEQGRLRTPSSLPELASLDISPEYLDKTHFRNPPKVEIDRDGVPRYRGEADEAEPSPRATITAAVSNGQPLLADSRVDAENELSGKRAKRYEPYGSGTKRPRKKTTIQTSGGDSQSNPSQSPTSTMSVQGAGAAGTYPVSDPQHPQYHQYGMSYYSQGMYPMPPAGHMYNNATPGQVYPPALPTASPTSPDSANSANSAPVVTPTSPAPAPQAPSGVTAPSHGHGQAQVPYPAYTGDNAQAGGNYSYYPTQSSHYAPYGGMGWPTTYPYAPQGLSGVPSNGVGKIEDDESHVSMRASAQAPQTVGGEDH